MAVGEAYQLELVIVWGRQAVEASEAFIQIGEVGVEKLSDVEIFVEQAASKELCFLPHRCLQIIAIKVLELVAIGRHGAEISKREPAIEEAVEKRGRARIFEHPLNLGGQCFGLHELARV